MFRFRSLPRLALRRMRRNWRLLSSVATGTLVAAAVLSATSIYSDAIRDLGLQHALDNRDLRDLDVTVAQSNIPVSAEAYQRARERQDQAVYQATGGTAGAVVRQGSSATFYPTLPGDAVRLDDSQRPRANVIFRSDLTDHIEVVEGTFPRPMPEAPEGPIDVAVGAATAEEHGLSIGDEFDLHPYWNATSPPVLVRIVAFVRELDPTERYWGRAEERIDARERSWATYRFFVDEATLFGALREAMPSVAADYANVYQMRLDLLNARNALPIANSMGTLPIVLNATEERPVVSSGLENVLRTFDEKLFFTRIPLLVLLLQIGAIVAYYLVMVSTMLVERQGAEIATMRSRGATTFQLLAIYGVEGTVLAALAALIGPPLAGAVISLLGATPAFSSLSGGGALSVHIGGTAYILAGVGALIAFFSLMIPAWRVTRASVVEFKRSAARPQRTPLFLRYYLDVVLVLVVAAVFWRLSQQEELFTESLFGETNVDPVLLATPAVFMVTVGVVFLRLFPVGLRFIAWLVGWTRSVAILVGMRSLVRQPSHYTRLILLLMFATGIGMFGATFSATLGRSYEDRAGYQAGADIRGTFDDVVLAAGDDPFRELVAGVPADAYSLVSRLSGSVYLQAFSSASVDILAVDPETFDDVAYIRDDFSTVSVDEMMETLAANALERAEGDLMPAGATQIGLWARFPDIRGRINLGVTLRDSTGRVATRILASVAPQEEGVDGWRFYSAELQPERRPGGRAPAELIEPTEVTGVYFQAGSRISAQRGVADLGPLMATTAPAAEPTDGFPGAPGLSIMDAPWPDAATVTSFTDPRYQVIRSTSAAGVNDTARPAVDAPPGLSEALHYEWLDSTFSPTVRGLGIGIDAEPAIVYLSANAAAALELQPGDMFLLSVGSRHVRSRLAGVLDYFPTHDPAGRTGLALVEGSRLLNTLNAAVPDRTLRRNEAWFATDDPVRATAILEEAGATAVVGREDLQLQQQDDPLIAAGWSGILAISFGAVLLLSAIGFIVYSYLTAQQRGLEFAIMRTLGFSKPQIFSVVLFEHLFVIATGMGLGTLVGLRVGSIMMGFLATDETGAAVVPPFILGVSWPQVFAVWAILGTVFVVTIGAVVALYFRLAVHRVLRIGDA